MHTSIDVWTDRDDGDSQIFIPVGSSGSRSSSICYANPGQRNVLSYKAILDLPHSV